MGRILGSGWILAVALAGCTGPEDTGESDTDVVDTEDTDTDVVDTDDTDDTDDTGDTDPPDTTAPLVGVVFPPPATFTEADTVLVRGTASDETALDRVRVGEVVATLAEDGSFVARVPLELGPNALQVEALDEAGNRSTLDLPVLRTWGLAEVRDLFWDEALEAFLVLDRRQDALVAVTTEGHGRVLSDRGHGRGPDLYSPRGMVRLGGDVLVSDDQLDAVIAIDPDTGDRRVVSDDAVGEGPQLVLPRQLQALDDTSVLLVDEGLLALLAVDVETGDRAVVSDVGRGTGPVWTSPISFDADGERAYIIDSRLRAVIGTDLATGDRWVVSDAVTGGGPLMVVPNDLFLVGDGTALVSDNGIDGVFRIDLETGERAIVSGGAVGSGPPMGWPRAVTRGPEGDTWVADSNLGALVRVEAEGRRTVVSSARAGDGETWRQPQGLVVQDGLAYVVDDLRDALVEVDPATAEQRVVADLARGIPLTASPVALAPLGEDWLVLDAGTEELLVVDRETGASAVVSGGEVGEGPALTDAMAMTAGDGVAWVALGGLEPGLLAVSLESGARRLVSGRGQGAGPEPADMGGVAVLNGEVLVSDAFGVGGELIGIDPATGDRRIFSALGERGWGSPFADPGAISVDGDALLVCDPVLPGVVRVDGDTGDRRVVTDVGVGAGPLLRTPVGASTDPATGHLLVVDRGVTAIFVVDAQTGERVVLLR